MVEESAQTTAGMTPEHPVETSADDMTAIVPVDSAAPDSSASYLSSSKVTIGRYEIDITRPLAAFEHNQADAYECTSSETGRADHVAIVVKGRHPVRQSYIDLLIGNTTFQRLMELRTAHSVSWPDDTRRFVLIFRRPSGVPLMARHKQKTDPLTEDALKKNVIRPVTAALRSLGHVGLFHGNVRPDTIFISTQDNAESTLQECISSVPGMNQPIMYETVERAMADAHGRYDGSIMDDIYALGVTVAIMLRGSNPLQNKEPHQILEDKLNFGSYVIMVEGLRLAPGMNEFLRGTLNDDERQRWGLDQITTWLDGNRTTTKLSSATQKAQRALEFNGKKYTRPRMLAKDLYKNVKEAVELIENGQLLKWIERAVNDQVLHDTVNAAIQNAHVSGRSAGFEDKLLCFVSMALDPSAPLRYKELRIFPHAIGYSLADAYLNNRPLQSYAELIRDRYGWHWLNHKDNFHTRHNQLMHALDQASKTVIRRGINYGLERCLYALCDDAPCMSDLFDDYYVISCNGLLHSLDKVADRYKDTRPTIDRHVASFIMAHDNHDNAGLLHIIDENDRVRRSLATLTLFQQLQKRFENPKLEGLCQWLAKDAETVIERFSDQQLKKRLLKFLPKEIKTGELTRVLALIDNPVQVKKDVNDFALAQQQFAHYAHEHDTIRNQLELNPEYGNDAGRQTAFIIAMTISGMMIAATLLIYFTR